MPNMLTLCFFIIIGLFSAQVDAQRLITLSPNESKQLKNNALWTVNATCTIKSIRLNQSKIKIRVLKNAGTVNGKSLSTGQATFVTVTNNSTISVSAETGTEINLINLSSDGLQAVCST